MGRNMQSTAQVHPLRYVSRGGEKLAAALQAFSIDVHNRICADLGSHVGGFVDCLLQNGARRVYSVDTSYGTLAWKLRKDPRVVVLERTNAMHVALPESVDLVTIDVGWTPQRRVLVNLPSMISPMGTVISLIKPHYEAPRDLLDNGVLSDEMSKLVLERVLGDVATLGFRILARMESPLRGHGGNREFLVQLAIQSSFNPPAGVAQ